jgi:hypothetical protein
LEFVALTAAIAFLFYFYAALATAFYRHFFGNKNQARKSGAANNPTGQSSLEYEKEFRALYCIADASTSEKVSPNANALDQSGALRIDVVELLARPQIYDTIKDFDQSPVHSEVSKDAWDPWFPANEYRLPVQATVEIEYTDIEDRSTNRRITTQYIGTPSEKMISAYCHLRRANRSFRNERIDLAVDPSSGELIDDLWEWLYKKYADSTEATVRRTIEEDTAIAIAMHFAARANGIFSAKKKSVVAAALRAISRDERIDVGQATRFVDSVKLPTIIDYRRALKSIAKGDAYKRLVVAKCIERMIATRKRPNAIEAMAVEEMMKTIGAKRKN